MLQAYLPSYLGTSLHASTMYLGYIRLSREPRQHRTRCVDDKGKVRNDPFRNLI